MTHQTSEHHLDTAVIGGGQAGLAMGCFLSRQDRAFVILDAGDRVGETWRNRWDSLKLFTPGFHDGLPGLPFPAPGGYLPTKDEAADYLELYARKFALPVRFGRHVDSLVPHHDGYLLSAGHERYVTEQVVVATGPYQRPKIPGSPRISTRRSRRCTPAPTATPISCPRPTCLSLVPATRGRRSPWNSPRPAGRTSPGETLDTYPSASSTTASLCGWPTTCLRPTPRSAGR